MSHLVQYIVQVKDCLISNLITRLDVETIPATLHITYWLDILPWIWSSWEQFGYLCRCWDAAPLAAQQSSFSFFPSSENILCRPDNILGIETTLACFAESKKILITCSEAAFTRKTLLLFSSRRVNNST